MSHGSLFTGIGLLDLGLVLAGLPEPEWVCEQDDWRREHVLAKRFPDAVRRDDVRTVGIGTVRPVRLIVGGFPCKGASTAGKRNGFDHNETVLWREMARAVRELRPEYVLLENVANLLAVHGGAVWGEVLGDLAALGFDVEWDCVPAAAVGAPHLRDRVFAVAAHAESGRARRSESPRRECTGRAGSPRSAAPPADPNGDTWRAQPEPGTERQGAPATRGPRAHAADASSSGRRTTELDLRPGQPDAGRGVAVDWGAYADAIERWERELGRSAPEPLVRRMDDRSAARVERSRLSALGDGVQVQVGRLMGEHLLSIDPTLRAGERDA